MTTEENTSHMPILQLKLKITKENIQWEPYTHYLPLSLTPHDSTRRNSSSIPTHQSQVRSQEHSLACHPPRITGAGAG